ncbi:fimbrial protein [Serratia sp. PL7]|nr:fimbrial protein [Serratia sp. PL7]OKP27179.1 hypothetical protein BSQ40_16375 [Serratia fonticola]
MKKIAAIVFCMLAGMNMAQAASVWGSCTPDKGTQVFGFDFKPKIATVAENQAGLTKARIYNWNLGGTYPGTCNCGTNEGGNNYYKAEIPGLVFDRTLSGLNYYAINKYLSIASELYIGGNVKDYVATPINDYSNNSGTMCAVSSNYASGSQGYVSLYFIRPFVGEVVIPPTPILKIYGTKIKGRYDTIPLAQVTMSATVTVPQSCNINAGQVINVNFGDIKAGDIITKGAGVDGFTPKVVDLTLACSNISDGVKISLSINGEISSGDETALATSNTDIGIRILDAMGGTVTPNGGLLPVSMNYATQTGTSTMSVAPINVTGNRPSAGLFNATATIRAEME